MCLKTFERLIEDPERLTQAVAQDRGVIESFLDVLRGIKNSVVIKLTGSEKAMLDEAERTLTNLLRGEAGIVEGERFSYVGENANLNENERWLLNQAKKMEAAIGLHPDQEAEIRERIRYFTNWFRGVDGKWRMEVDDSRAQFFPDGTARGTAVSGEQKVKDFLFHPELERLEPELFELPMRIDPTIQHTDAGRYQGKIDGILVGKNTENKTVLHEVQHGIEDIEGFVRGSDTQKAKLWALIEAYENVKNTFAYRALRDKEARYQFVEDEACRRAGVDNLEKAADQYYQKAAGEVEARDVVGRIELSAEKRKSQAPDLSGSVKYAQDPNGQYIDMLKAMGYTESEISKLR